MMRSLSTRLCKAIPSVLLAVVLAACSAITKPDLSYQEAKVTAPLKYPAGLSPPPVNEETRIPRLPSGRGVGEGAEPAAKLAVPPTLALESNDITVERDGALRWLLIQSSPQDLWQGVLEFWPKNGMPLTYENAELNVMETDWVTPPSSPAGAPSADQGGPTDVKPPKKVKYRLRLAQFPDEDGTELYLTVRKQGGSAPAGQTSRSGPPSGTALENEMLRKLMVYLAGLGVATDRLFETLPSPSFATLVQDKHQGPSLKLSRPPEMAWRHLAQAIDRLGDVIIGHEQKPRAGKRKEPASGHSAPGKPSVTRKPGEKGSEAGERRAREDGSGVQPYDRFIHKYLIAAALPKPKASTGNEKKKGWFSWLLFGRQETTLATPDFNVTLTPDKSATVVTVGLGSGSGVEGDKGRTLLEEIYQALR